METTETYHERQENELQALKAIYSAELRDLREADSLKVSCPPEIVITLYPQQGESTNYQEIHTQIDLHVTCVGTYPEDVPVIELESSKGISRENVSLLQGQLESLASELRGEVMIHELAQHVKEFLHLCYKPGFKSFHDEMENRLEQQNLHQMQLKKLKEDEEKQAIQEQIRKKTEALAEEKGRQRRRNRVNSEEKEIHLMMAEKHLHLGKKAERSKSCCFVRASSFPNQRYNTVSEGDGNFICDHHGTRIIHFNNHGERQVQRGKCISHNQKGSIVYPALDIITGEFMAVVEWTVKCQNTLKEGSNNFPGSGEKNEDISCIESANYLKQIASIEQEFTFLQKLYHPNLVHYLNMKYTEERDCIIINILEEFVSGTNLAMYLTENLSVDTDVLRHCAIGILNALDYLHQNNVVHKDLRDTSVFIDKSGIVRLGDYSLDKRLSIICQSSAEEKPENIFPPSIGRGGKKNDIHRFGILLLSLIKGCIITDSEPEISNSVRADLRDFLLKCLMKEERQRWSAKQLLEHQFVKDPIEKGFNPKSDLLKKEKRRNSVSDNEERDVDIPQYLPANPKGSSRIKNEFELIKLLGKGAFGDVLKAKNKLDGRLYAIKRIKLNPKNKQLNKKITREVKLLSRLNHENVVRYYNSWIECGVLDSNVESTSIAGLRSDSEMVNSSSESNDKHPKITLEEPSQWNKSFCSGGTQDPSEMEDEESDDEEEDDWIAFLSRSDTSESIMILEDGSVLTCKDQSSGSNTKDESDARIKKSSAADHESDIGGIEEQFMYIQMEFCEKSTLRTAIDDGLNENKVRVWRLFRELLEGLDHLHQQGMIHRDLKPVNIFLDSNDHVKIGDFGLATTNIITRTGSFVNEQLLESIDTRSGDNRSFLNYFGDGSMTGEVGTALYAAPELFANGGKTLYSQKVDIYSLGIIFFEMCYHPLMTGMERVKVLMGIRLKDIIMPADFSENEMPQQYHIIRWLLNHDPNKRPTSLELLQSDFVPPPQLEETELQEMVRHTLLNPQSKAYKYLVDSCFNQVVTPADDVTFDMSLHPSNLGSLPPTHKYLLQEAVKERIVAVFRRHGAICVPTPLLLPSSASHRSSGAQSVNGQRRSPPDPSQRNASYVRLMTRSGGIVSLPHDLRMSFARYVAWNGISLLKRYSVDRVYREKRPYGFHPRELYECAFDIVTPDSGYLLAEAEILSIAWEVVNEFPALRELNYSIQLSHTSLLRAILLHCGIEEGKHQDIYRILWEARDEKYTKFQVQTRLMSLNMSEQVILSLLSLVEVEGPLSKVMSGAFKGVIRRKGEAASLAQQAFHELETIIGHVEALGVKCPVVIAPGLVYNVHQYSGMMCQMVCEMKKKRRKGGLDIIAAGGRYDSLLASYRQVLHLTGMTSHESSQSAVGISLSLERILSALHHEQSEGEKSWSGDQSMANLSPLDAVLCCMGQIVPFMKQMARIVRDLWTAGIRTSLIDSLQTIEDVQDYCRDLSIPHIIILKDTETGTVRVSSWEKDRYNERKVSVCDLVEHMQRAVKVNMIGDNILGCDANMLSGVSTGSSLRLRSCGDTSSSYSIPSGGNMVPLSPSISSCSSTSTSASRNRITFHFIAVEGNITPHMKRRYENVIMKHIEQVLPRYSRWVRLEILGVQLDEAVIRMVTSLLNIDGDKNAFEKSVATVIERLPVHRKYLSALCEEIHNLKFEKNSAVLILYSLTDNFSKAL